MSKLTKSPLNVGIAILLPIPSTVIGACRAKRKKALFHNEIASWWSCSTSYMLVQLRQSSGNVETWYTADGLDQQAIRSWI